jgi:hypothetical protein
VERRRARRGAGWIRASPARSCSGGTTCTARRTSPSPRAPSIPRTAQDPGIYAEPPELRAELSKRLGTFPLFHFWGPNADIRSSRWIRECARYIYDTRGPTLTLVYLPHLDYNLQRLAPATRTSRETCGRSTPSAANYPALRVAARDGGRLEGHPGRAIKADAGTVSRPDRAVARSGSLSQHEGRGQ